LWRPSWPITCGRGLGERILAERAGGEIGEEQLAALLGPAAQKTPLRTTSGAHLVLAGHGHRAVAPPRVDSGQAARGRRDVGEDKARLQVVEEQWARVRRDLLRPQERAGLRPRLPGAGSGAGRAVLMQRSDFAVAFVELPRGVEEHARDYLGYRVRGLYPAPAEETAFDYRVLRAAGARQPSSLPPGARWSTATGRCTRPSCCR